MYVISKKHHHHHFHGDGGSSKTLRQSEYIRKIPRNFEQLGDTRESDWIESGSVKEQ